MKRIVLATVFALSTFSMAAPQANAYAIVSLAGYGSVPNMTRSAAVNAALCVLLLPLCVLKENGAPNGSFNAESALAAQGLTDGQIASFTNTVDTLSANDMIVDPSAEGGAEQFVKAAVEAGVPEDDAAFTAQVFEQYQ